MTTTAAPVPQERKPARRPHTSEPSALSSTRARVCGALIAKMPDLPDSEEARLAWREQLNAETDAVTDRLFPPPPDVDPVPLPPTGPPPQMASALTPATRGTPIMGWVAGIGTDREDITDSWLCEQPHLVIAGCAASGKSSLIHSLMCQMMHNNTPEDLQIWVAEPKNELQIYRDVAHVTRFVDATACTAAPHEMLAALLSEAVTEMRARHAAMAQHRDKPANIVEARLLAADKAAKAEHLNFPYVLIVVDECANYFVKPVLADREAHTEIMTHLGTLTREARAAGIHLCVATQYPTSECLPATLRSASRIIGLRAASKMMSVVMCGRPGMEQLQEAGTGLLLDPTTHDDKLLAFRVLQVTPHDVAATAAALPRGGPDSKLPAGLADGQRL